MSIASLPCDPERSAPDSINERSILEAIEHASHLLPAQGPITAFVHHNTLHAFEGDEFDTAVRKASHVFGCHPYLPEARYRELHVEGRIGTDDIEAVLLDQLGDRADDLLGFLGPRFYLQRAILNFPFHDGPSVDLSWVIGDTNALNRFRKDAPKNIKEQFIAQTRQWVMRDLRDGKNSSRDQEDTSSEIDKALLERVERLLKTFGASNIERWSDRAWESFTLHLLWTISEYGVGRTKVEEYNQGPGLRARNWLLTLTGVDPDEMVNETLIRFSAGFLDQGFCGWVLPDRDNGFYNSFIANYRQRLVCSEPWRKGLASELDRLVKDEVSPIESIKQSLVALGVPPSQLTEFLGETLLALRGFAGMLWQLESRGDRVSRAMPAGTLLEFLAIRLILDRLAAGYIARRELDFQGELSELRDVAQAKSESQDNSLSRKKRMAFRVFEVAQLLGWNPHVLARLRLDEWQMIVRELDQFSGVERRYIYHLAYERKYRNETLDAVGVHAARTRDPKMKTRTRGPETTPDFQILCCLDEREESLRRHLEEVHPACETFGAAGFFAIPMYYRGAADAHFTPLCPVVIKPSHHVREEVVYSLMGHESKRKRARRTIGTVTHRVHIGSRTFTGGWLGTALLGSLATIPLVTRILFPRLTAQFRRLIGGFVQPPAVTRLQLERDPANPPGPDKDQLGFTVQEMAESVERLLRDIGLTENFARIFFVCGHGSASLNNPHEAAHDCGACAGGRGGPNARAFSQMANDPRVREIVARMGVTIPASTIFIGCYHNTCDDSLTYYDLDQIPSTHQEDFEKAFAALDESRKRDAHERCRRFESAPLDLSFNDALKHVEGRAEDLSQVRPEYGHATNALCFVGSRDWNRGMFLDRRAFLQSYDPSLDDEDASVLERVLQAVIPVCAGINLEYYFSFVDPVGYGCGTKLPHNITSLIGVMNGAASDLRTGLPWQMVEIHEPVRLLFVIEATAKSMERIINNNPSIKLLCDGNWVQLSILDPETSEIFFYRNRRFQPYTPESKELASASSSVDWYRGWRDHLKFASVGKEFVSRSNES